MNSSVRIGNLVFENCEQLVVADGHEIIGLERRSDGQLLLNVDVFDESGQHVAKLRRNAWVFNDAQFVVSSNPADLQLSATGRAETRAGTTFVRASVLADGTLYAEGRLFTPTGRQISFGDAVTKFDNRPSALPITAASEQAVLQGGFRISNAAPGVLLEVDAMTLAGPDGTIEATDLSPVDLPSLGIE